jgi:hypothetical protein
MTTDLPLPDPAASRSGSLHAGGLRIKPSAIIAS